MNTQTLKKGLMLHIHLPQLMYEHAKEVVPGELTSYENITTAVYIDTDEAAKAFITLITKAVNDFNEGKDFEKRLIN